MGAVKLAARLAAVLMLLAFMTGGCAPGLGGAVEKAVSHAEQTDISGIAGKVESAVSEAAQQASGAVERFSTALSGNQTSFTVSAEDGAGRCSELKIEDIYIMAADGTELEIRPGKTLSVTVECPEDMLDYGLSADIEDGTVTVSCDPERMFSCKEFKITVTGVCESVYIGTGMDVDIDAAGAENFTMRVDGAVNGEIENLDAGTVSLTINGAADLELSGRTGSFECVMNGAGSIDADELAAAGADVEVNGAGNMDLNVSDTLKAALRGAGSISYTGNPEVHKEIEGLGKIEKDRD